MPMDVPHEYRISNALHSGRTGDGIEDATFALLILTRPTPAEIDAEIARIRQSIQSGHDNYERLSVDEPDHLLRRIEMQNTSDQNDAKNIEILERVARVLRNRDVAIELDIIDPDDRDYPYYD